MSGVWFIERHRKKYKKKKETKKKTSPHIARHSHYTHTCAPHAHTHTHTQQNKYVTQTTKGDHGKGVYCFHSVAKKVHELRDYIMSYKTVPAPNCSLIQKFSKMIASVEPNYHRPEVLCYLSIFVGV